MNFKKIFLSLCVVFICTLSVSNCFALNDSYYDYSQQLTEVEAKKNVTRGEFSHYLSNLLQQKGIIVNGENESAFVDIAPTHSYYNDIIYLKKLSIVKGVGNDEFRPDNNITFQEAATMLSRIFLTDSDINMKYGAYPAGYIKYALTTGLIKDVSAVGEEYITFNNLYVIMQNLEESIVTYDLIKKLGCDAYNGEVYIDYYPKSWQGFEEKPLATTNGYFRILPAKLLYSYDNENWHILYEDVDGKRIYYNLPENVDISGSRYDWAYNCFVNAPFDINKKYYSYDNKIWTEGSLKNAEVSELSSEREDFILGIEKETIIYDSDSGLYFSWQPYYDSSYYSKRYEATLADVRYNMIWVSNDAMNWKGIKLPEDMLFLTSAGLNRGADRKANAIIIDGAVSFTDEEKAFLDGEEKIAANQGLGYDKPLYKTEKYILHFSDVKELFQ